MQYNTLGKTGLRVSAAGLGTGGFSRLGLKAGKTEDESARLIHEAVGLGINFIDTAASYGTEGVVGKALKTIPRDQVVIATKAQFRGDAFRAAREGDRGARQFAAPDGHRLCRRVQSARRGARRIRLCAQHDRAGAAQGKEQGQDQAHRHHREPDRRFHQRDAQARGERSRLGGLHGGLPHDAPGRAAERVSGHAPEGHRHAFDVCGAKHLRRSAARRARDEGRWPGKAWSRNGSARPTIRWAFSFTKAARRA